MIKFKSIKKFFSKDFRQAEQIRKALTEARLKTEKELKKTHGEKVSKIVHQMNTEKQIEVENLKIEMQKLILENKKLEKRNEYLEKLHFDTIEVAKTNSIVSQEMSTDAIRLEESIVRITGLIHGINEKAQRHYEKMESDKMKVKEKLKDME